LCVIPTYSDSFIDNPEPICDVVTITYFELLKAASILKRKRTVDNLTPAEALCVFLKFCGDKEKSKEIDEIAKQYPQLALAKDFFIIKYYRRGKILWYLPVTCVQKT
jgi:hypothetical protein